MHYYTFNIGDYVSSTQHLEPMEDLAYRRMLDLYYQKESPLPDDVNQIARLIRMRSHIDCIENVLQDFFVLEADGYHQERADKSLKAIYDKSEKARRSAEARWDKKKNSSNASKKECGKNANAKDNDANACNSDANVMQTDCDGNATHYPLPITHYTEEQKNMSSKPDNRHFEIFEYWKDIMKKSGNTTLSAKRTKVIKDRLKQGYSVDEIKQAIRHCANTAHNMGYDRNGNKTGKKYDDIELICRNAENLERFRDNAGDMAQGAPHERHQAVSGQSGESIQMQQFRAAQARRAASRNSGLDAMGNNDKDVLDLDQSQWIGTVGDLDS